MSTPSWNVRLAHAAACAAATVGVCAALFSTGCKPKPTVGAVASDSTLARDLALASADSAAQPRLSDTAASAGAAVAAPPPAESAAPAPTPAPTPAPESAAPKQAVAHTAAAHRPRTHHAPAPAIVSAASPSAPVAAAAPPPPPPPRPPLVAASGTSFDIVLTDTVTTATAHAGDPVTATVAADVKDGSGALVVPAGSQVHGTVTTSSGSAHSPHLVVAFTSVDVGGRSYPVQANISSLPVVQSRRTARAAQAGEVGGGAVAGGLLGRLIGGKKSGGTLIGAVAGAAAGAVVADKTENHDAVLPKGAHVTLQLTSAVSVPAS